MRPDATPDQIAGGDGGLVPATVNEQPELVSA